MTHLDEGMIQSYLHGELPQAARDHVERHASACNACAGLITEARQDDDWVLNRLALIDVVPPAGRLVTPPAPAPAMRALRRAAVIVVTVVLGGTGVAWGLTAGRTFLRETFGVGRPDERAADTPSDSPNLVPSEMTTGIAVVPSARFTITFEATQDSGTLTVAIVETEQVAVRATGAGVAFESRPDGIVIRNRGADGDYDVSIPSRAPFVEVRLGSRVLFSLERSSVRASGSRDATGRYVIPLAGS